MRTKFSDVYVFFPKTFIFPKDRNKLRKEWDSESVLIVKPGASC